MKSKRSLATGQGTPTPVNGTVTPKRVRNEEKRSREHLTPGEIELLIKAARSREGRYGHRNIQNTVRYTELAAERFKSFWEAEE